MSSETLHRIRLAALHILTHEGLAHVSMRRVAQQVGLTATALYRHYESKDHLIMDLVRTGFNLFYQYELEALRAPTPTERFVLLGDSYLRFALENPHYYKLIFSSEWVCQDPNLKQQAQHLGGATLQFVVDRLRDMMDHGDIPRSDPAPLALAVWSLSHGIVSLHQLGALEDKCSDLYGLLVYSVGRLVGKDLVPFVQG